MRSGGMAPEEHTVLHAIKPFDQRYDTSKWLESDADEQLLIKIPFTGSCKLKVVDTKAALRTALHTRATCLRPCALFHCRARRFGSRRCVIRLPAPGGPLV